MKIHSIATAPTEPVSHNPAITKKVMLHGGEISNLVYFSHARFAPGEVAGAHSHADMSEVFYVESGAGTIRINQAPHLLKPGVCVAVEPGEIHEIENDGFEDLVLTYFGILASPCVRSQADSQTQPVEVETVAIGAAP